MSIDETINEVRDAIWFNSLGTNLVSINAQFAMPRVADTVRFWVYKQGYFSPSPLRNPYGIVPAGPRIDWAPGP